MPPCINSIFGPTLSDGYSTSKSSTVYPTGVFFVDFFNGIVQGGYKTEPCAVRAVRAGSPSGAFVDLE
jgi:hypothetical protein